MNSDMEAMLASVLTDERRKQKAAKQLTSRIKEVNQAAKMAATPEERKKFYFLKAALVKWGVSHFGFKIISQEYDPASKETMVVCRLAQLRATVHVPLTALGLKLTDLAGVKYHRTLTATRAIRRKLVLAN